jgi:hypothetical protein
MTHIEHIKQKIARLQQKLASATDPESRRYYELCLIGWQRWLEKVERGRLRSVRRVRAENKSVPRLIHPFFHRMHAWSVAQAQGREPRAFFRRSAR